MSLGGASLKMVKEIHAVYDPFCSVGIKLVREFVRRVSSPNLLESNPKFKLQTDIKSDGNSPVIKITYLDKEVQEIKVKDGDTFEKMYRGFIDTCKVKETS